MIATLTNEKMVIRVADDFSETPGPRHVLEGAFSGEEFREDVLDSPFLEAERTKRKLMIDLDGTEGFATSFLEEAFGGLARKYGKDRVLQTLEFISTEEPYLVDEIIKYIEGGNLE